MSTSVSSSSCNKKDYFEVGDIAVLDQIADQMAESISTTGNTRTHCIVTIPAHNEADCIELCLQAFLDQRALCSTTLDTSCFEIIVLCHNCSDSTFEKCINFGFTHPQLRLVVLKTNRAEVHNVGAVRRLLMNIAYKRLADDDGFIATTDADTLVHKHWVASILSYLDSHFDLICGRIEVDVSSLPSHAQSVLDLKEKYRELASKLRVLQCSDELEPDYKHFDNSGPNLAVRAKAYSQVGGMPAIGFCEDIAFYDAIIWGGFKIIHCLKTRVTTSGRTTTKVPWGFGTELKGWSENSGLYPEVEGLNALLQRYKIYQMAASCLKENTALKITRLSQMSGITHSHLVKIFQEYHTLKGITHKLEKELDASKRWRARFPKITLNVAYAQLECYSKDQELKSVFLPNL